MKANAYKEHVLLIPEDEALERIALGFAGRFHNVQVDPPVRGKPKLMDQFLQSEVPKLNQFPKRFLVLVRDFDGSPTCDLQDVIPGNLLHRVFVLGPLDEAENLRTELRELGLLQPNTWDEIGRRLADECLAGEDELWQIGQLSHLIDQVNKLRASVLDLLQSPS